MVQNLQIPKEQENSFIKNQIMTPFVRNQHH